MFITILIGLYRITDALLSLHLSDCSCVYHLALSHNCDSWNFHRLRRFIFLLNVSWKFVFFSLQSDSLHNRFHFYKYSMKKNISSWFDKLVNILNIFWILYLYVNTQTTQLSFTHIPESTKHSFFIARFQTWNKYYHLFTSEIESAILDTPPSQ